MGKISKPQPIHQSFHLLDFDCGIESLNEWLHKRALKNEQNRASRTYVVCDEDNRVLGYYSLASGSIELQQAPGKIRRNMPSPIPVLLLGRLAVDKSAQGKHIGRGLLKDAVLRAISVAEQVGVKALLVHAINPSARAFYLKYGFIVSPAEEMTLILPIANLRG